MLEEGYIEILAPTLDTPNAQRVRERMARYDGVHLACFGTPDAEAEHRRLAAQGFEPEPLVNLERTLEGGETVRFKVVYVPPAKMPEGRVQYVEQLTPEAIWTGEPRPRQRRDRPESGLRRRGRSGAKPRRAGRASRGLLPTPEGALRAPRDCAAAGCSSAPGRARAHARRGARRARRSPAMRLGVPSSGRLRRALQQGWGSRCKERRRPRRRPARRARRRLADLESARP